MSRRFTWLPFRKSDVAPVETRSASVPLPGTTSMSSLVASTISSPVLMSTTNTRVAKRESIPCNDMSLLNLSAKMNKEGEHLQHRQGNLGISQDWSTGRKFVDNKQFHLAPTIEGMRKKIKHVRRSSTSFLLENTWSRRLRENSPMPASQSNVPSRVMNSPVLYRDESTDSIFDANLKRDPLLSLGTPSLVILSDPSTEKYTSQPEEAPCLPRLQSGGTNSLLMESLSESFTNATEEFNLEAVPNVHPYSGPLAASKLKSVRSCFSLHSVSSELSKSAVLKKGA